MKTKEQIGFHSGAGILLISAVMVKIIGALFKIPISSDYCLSDEGFGYFSYAYDCFTPLYTIAMGGFPVALAQIIARRSAEQKRGEAVFFSARKLYAGLGLVFAFLIIFLCLIQWLYGKSLAWLMPFAAIAPAAFFCSAMSSYRGYYEGFGDMKPTAVSELIEALCKLLLGFSFAFITVKVTHNLAFGAAAAMVGITVGTAFAYLYLRHTFYKREKSVFTVASALERNEDRTLTKQVLAIALPITLAALSANMAPLFDAITSQAQLGADLYGLRGKAYTLYNLVPAFAVFLAVSAVPAVAHTDFAGNSEKRRKDVRSILKFSAVISFPMAAGLTSASTAVMRLLFGDGELLPIGGSLLRIFGVAAFFSGLAIPLTGILQAVGKQKIALFNIAVGAGIKIALNCLLVPLPSVRVFGTAYGTLGCYCMILILHCIALHKSFGSLIQLLSVCFKPLLASVICGGTAWAILQIGIKTKITLVAIFVAVLVYFLLLILFKCFDLRDFPENWQDAKLVKFCVKHRILR